MIKITEAAAKQIRAAAQGPEAQNMVLRLAARQLNDGSVTYGMGFDQEREADEQVIASGIEVLIAKASLPFLEGVTLDFVELEPGDFRFIFIPPTAAPAPQPE
jgi:iron-sulfur cluster assembly protein